jgi:YidC/Oxa1 family membrane protein insertase
MPRRKRCPLPEVPNPNIQSPHGGNKQSILAVTILFFLILCAHLYFQPVAPKQLDQARHDTKERLNGSSSPKGDRTRQTLDERQNTNTTPLIFATATKDKPTEQPVKGRNQFGWLTVIAKPLYLALRLLYQHGVGNWGWAIIVLTAVFNLLMLWPRMMSMKSSLRTMRLQPKVDEIKRRYAELKMNDPRRGAMGAEIAALYKDEGANLYAGCLPLVLQMPLFLAYIRVLQHATELQQAHWLWLTDLSLPDPVHALPVLIVVTMGLTQFITPSPGMDPTQRRLFAFVMPIVMGFTLWHYASGLALYWATGNVINLGIQVGINHTKMGKEMHALTAKRGSASRR